MNNTTQPKSAQTGHNYSTTSGTVNGKSNVAAYLLKTNDRTSRRKSKARSQTRKVQ
jgi:hypothetical protein